MTTERASRRAPGLRIRPRIYRGADIALGPGKIEQLEAIEQTGSIARAARQVDMSYMRAWTLVKTMNACFEPPLVRVARGGARGGSAQLTRNGREVVALYRLLVHESERATGPIWRRIQKRIKK